jgi:hypothetical protein
VLDRYIDWKRNELSRRLQQESTEENRKEVQQWSDNQNRWRASTFRGNSLQRIQDGGFDAELRRVTPDWLSATELAAVESFRNQLVRLYDGCQKKGGYTQEGSEFYDRYFDIGGWDLKVKELFGVNPSELK